MPRRAGGATILPMPHEPRRSHDAVLQHRARRMRRQPTDAERKLWLLLRDRRLSGFKFRRQVPVDHYVLDFFCEEASLAVELDGDQHAEADAVAYDERRTKRLEERHIRVLRFTSRETLRDVYAVAKTILRVLTGADDRRPSPLRRPVPSPACDDNH